MSLDQWSPKCNKLFHGVENIYLSYQWCRWDSRNPSERGESPMTGKKAMFSQGLSNNQVAFSTHRLIQGIISQWRILAGTYVNSGQMRAHSEMWAEGLVDSQSLLPLAAHPAISLNLDSRQSGWNMTRYEYNKKGLSTFILPKVRFRVFLA